MISREFKLFVKTGVVQVTRWNTETGVANRHQYTIGGPNSNATKRLLDALQRAADKGRAKVARFGLNAGWLLITANKEN